MSSLILMRYRGLPNADDREVEEFLTAKACFVTMSGSNGLCFTAPVSLLSRLSASIGTLVQNTVEEGHTCLNLEVSDKGTFYRFCQFVYTGNYDNFTTPENVNVDDNTEKKGPLPSTSANFGGSTKSAAPSGGDLFGDSTKSAAPRGGGLFGSPTKSAAPSGGGLFGDSTKSAVPRGGGLFGSSTMSAAPSGRGLFGSPTKSAAPSGGGLFRPQPEGQIQHGFKLPYSIVSCRDTLRRITPSLIPAKRKHEELSDNNVNPRFSFKSLAISAFLQNHDPMYLWQAAAANKQGLFRNVLVGHAKIWQFAEKYAITDLMNVASSQLTRELACWTINDSAFITDFGRLVRHSYHDCSVGGNALQLLIARFAACVLEDVKDLESWQELLGEVPAFHSDLGHALAEVYYR